MGMNIEPGIMKGHEVGARSYKNTGRSNAAWVRVKKRFAGLRTAVEGYARFHGSMYFPDGTHFCRMGPEFAEWYRYLPNGTSICRMGLVFDKETCICQMGPTFAKWYRYLPNGASNLEKSSR